MKVGMMWYDGGVDGLAQRVHRAATYYQEKYGGQPNVCYVHPSGAEEGGPAGVEAIRVERSELVLPGHLWVGVERASAAESDRRVSGD
ncbi:MAG: hypothetical protein WBZ24_05540 [Anaerolineales bacterium]|jgi:hypothetical protein